MRFAGSNANRSVRSPPSLPASRGRFSSAPSRACGLLHVVRPGRHGVRVFPDAGGNAMNLGDLTLFVMLCIGYGYMFFWGL